MKHLWFMVLMLLVGCYRSHELFDAGTDVMVDAGVRDVRAEPFFDVFVFPDGTLVSMPEPCIPTTTTPVMYLATNFAQLYRYTLSNASIQSIGDTIAVMSDIAYHSSGRLVGATLLSGSLYWIDPNTAAIEFMGHPVIVDPSTGVETMLSVGNSMVASDDGTIWFFTSHDGRPAIAETDPLNLRRTQINFYMDGYRALGDLAFSGDDLYLAGYEENVGQNLLIRISGGKGVPVSISHVAEVPKSTYGIANDSSGKLYIGYGSTLSSIDPITGRISEERTLPISAIYGIAFPEEGCGRR